MRAALFYATREGQTARIARHIATWLRARRIDADLYDVKRAPAAIAWSRYQWICLAASVHVGRHEAEMTRFVKQHRSELERRSADFLSVTLSEAGAEDPHADPQRRVQAAADALRMIDIFKRSTGWTPAHVLPVAGTLAYSRYNPLIRFVMKRIARSAGAPTDTSRDYELTDWAALDRFVEEVVNAAEILSCGAHPLCAAVVAPPSA